MTLRHFQIFNTVCQEGSLTAAAQRLGISQPAVSIAIKELEAFYGTRLFERMNRRIYISPSGEALLQYVGTVLSQFDESVRVIRDEDYATECRFGVNVTVGETRLGDFMAGARAAQPAVQARVVTGARPASPSVGTLGLSGLRSGSSVASGSALPLDCSSRSKPPTITWMRPPMKSVNACEVPL